MSIEAPILPDVKEEYARQEAEIPEETPEEKQAQKERQELFSRLSPEYQIYFDMQAEKMPNEEHVEKTMFFAEFVKELNPQYLDFLNHFLEQRIEEAKKKSKKQEISPKEWQSFCEDYERKLEFFQNNYALPLNDEEAKEALMFLQKDSEKEAEAKISAWRTLADEWECEDSPPLIYLARAGFNLKETAPKVKDEHSKEGKKGKKQKGLCYEDWEHLQNYDFPDTATEDEIRYFIPKLISESTNRTTEEQQVLIDQIAKKLKEQCKECKNIDISMGEANQIANQIFAYYNQTKKRIPERKLWARTLTLHADGFRLGLGGFDAGGLGCDYWDWVGGSDPFLGSCLSGVEKLGNKKTRKQELTNPQP